MRSYNGKGHGVHSPFVYTFIKEVLNQKEIPASLFPIEAQRKILEANKQ